MASGSGVLRLYCVDNSDAAARSEDFFTSRLAFQLEAISCASKAAMVVPRAAQTGAAARAPLGGEAVSGATQQQHAPPALSELAVVCCGGRPQLALPATSDRAAILGLRNMEHRGDACQLIGGLRLALLTSKRAKRARVSAFVASKVPNLSRAECAQLGKAYADAAVGLDVVLLGPEADLSDGDREALEALTARTMYSASSSSSSGTSGGRAAGPGPSSSAGGRGSALQQPAAAHAQPGGQQLVLMPPPSDPSQQLWRQLEPLLEALQLEADPDSEGESSPSGPSSRVGSGSAGGRPPLPPRPLQRSAAGPYPTTGPLPSRNRAVQPGNCRYESLDSLHHMSADGFLRSWLPSYANVKIVFAQPGASSSRYCYISVYKMQLPKWHKIAEFSAGCMEETDVAPLPPDQPLPGPSTGQQQQLESQAQQHGGGSSSVGPAADGGVMVFSPRPRADADGEGGGDICTAAWRRGMQAPAATAGASCSSSVAASAASAPVAIARPPNPVPIHFSTRCSSAASAASAASSCWAGDGSPPAAVATRWVAPDARRGTLTLVASTTDARVKLLWSPRAPAQGAAAPSYASIFGCDAAAEAAAGGVDVEAAEMEVTLSPSRTTFRCVEGSSNAVLEVRCPRTIVRRRPAATPVAAPAPTMSALAVATGSTTSSSSSSSNISASSSLGGGIYDVGPDSDDDDDDDIVPSGTVAGRTQRGRPSLAPAPPRPSAAAGPGPSSGGAAEPSRLFFWLQQAWPSPSADAADASSSGSRYGGYGARGVGASGLAEELQALLECPPDYDPNKHNGGKGRGGGTPVELGPLPFSLVEEIMRASGRELLPDGTIAPASASASSSSASFPAGRRTGGTLPGATTPASPGGRGASLDLRLDELPSLTALAAASLGGASRGTGSAPRRGPSSSTSSSSGRTQHGPSLGGPRSHRATAALPCAPADAAGLPTGEPPMGSGSSGNAGTASAACPAGPPRGSGGGGGGSGTERAHSRSSADSSRPAVLDLSRGGSYSSSGGNGPVLSHPLDDLPSTCAGSPEPGSPCASSTPPARASSSIATAASTPASSTSPVAEVQHHHHHRHHHHHHGASATATAAAHPAAGYDPRGGLLPMQLPGGSVAARSQGNAEAAAGNEDSLLFELD